MEGGNIKLMDINQIYEAISHAETGSEKNPYIRTKVRNAPGGSSAFGPVQITGKLAEGANKQGYLTPESQKFYSEVMAPRYKQMLYHGNMKGKLSDFNPNYDYGGNADFDSKKYGDQYKKFALDIIKGVLNEAKSDEIGFVNRWRGKSEKEDPEYYRRYREGKNMNDLGQEMIRQLTR